jgi:hypothetical protein
MVPASRRPAVATNDTSGPGRRGAGCAATVLEPEHRPPVGGPLERRSGAQLEPTNIQISPRNVHIYSKRSFQRFRIVG